LRLVCRGRVGRSPEKHVYLTIDEQSS